MMAQQTVRLKSAIIVDLQMTSDLRTSKYVDYIKSQRPEYIYVMFSFKNHLLINLIIDHLNGIKFLCLIEVEFLPQSIKIVS